MCINIHQSTERPAVRQSNTGRNRGRLAASLLGLAALCLAEAGCTSVYHRSHRAIPPEPCTQLRLLVNEAHQAAGRAGQANGRLQERLDRGLGGAAVETDLDRLEMTALELERRVLAARDVAPACLGNHELIDEIDRLQQRSKAWLEQVHALRPD